MQVNTVPEHRFVYSHWLWNIFLNIKFTMDNINKLISFELDVNSIA